MEPTLIEYTLRDPLLFGDFRNACYEDEPRYYEDLLDYEAVYNLLLEVKDIFYLPSMEIHIRYILAHNIIY